MPEPGLTLTTQAPAAHETVLVLEADTTPSGAWGSIAPALESSVATAVRRLLATDGPTHHAVRSERLLEAGVDAVSDERPEIDTAAEAEAIATVLAGFDRAEETAGYEAASRLLSAFGQGSPAAPLGWPLPLAGGRAAPVRLLASADVTPTVTVRLRESFLEACPASQRRQICKLLTGLADAVDVRLLATWRQHRCLVNQHWPELPGNVSDQLNANRPRTPVAACAEHGRERFDPDGREVAILRALAAEAERTLAKSELVAEATVSDGRIKQCVLALDEADLVDYGGPRGNKRVELRKPGHALLKAIDAEAGRQQTLDEAAELSVSGSGQSSIQAVVSRAGRDEEEGEPTQTATEPYRTRWAAPSTHTAAAATAESGSVTAIQTAGTAAWADEPDHRRYVSIDEARGEVYVGFRTAGGLQTVVSTALALASPRLFDKALPPARLQAVVDEKSTLLRDARQIGCLSSEALDDATVLRDNLVAWGEELAELTRELRAEDTDDRAALRSEILRSAHGLATSIAHLLDAAGYDLIRELRIPRGLSPDALEEVATAVAKMSSQQARYGDFATYRQLFETRETKREHTLSPTVDATDPTGDLIGSFILRGPDVHRLRPLVEPALANPADLHEEAPEISVPVTVRTADRRATATAAQRVLSKRDLAPTRRAVSLLHALTASPYATAEALYHLDDDNGSREVRPDELRYALSCLDADRLLPEIGATTPARLLGVLLETDERLAPTELADRADVSERTVRRHRDTLAALSLVDVDYRGWRLDLSFADDEGRYGPDEVWPTLLEGDVRLADAVSDVLAALLPPSEYADPRGETFEALSFPPDPWVLRDDPALAGWIDLAARLVDADRPDRAETEVAFGAESAQAPITATGDAVEPSTNRS